MCEGVCEFERVCCCWIEFFLIRKIRARRDAIRRRRVRIRFVRISV